ncbi:MAG: hypothetical protein ABEI97_00150 [Candidatus Nanohaloarchaea archaeon]
MDDTVAAWLEDDFAERWRDFAGEDTDSDAPTPPTDIDSSLEDGESQPRRLAVVERDLPGHLFGFTRRNSSHVVVNNRLYQVDRERTVRHEKTHHLHPKDEMTIRYINGDPDVRHTLSFNGNNPARLGSGSTGRPRNTAAYGSDRDGYSAGRTDTYI